MEQSNVVHFHNAFINADEKELDRLWEEVAPQRLIKFFPAKYADDGTNHFLKHLTTKELWLSSPMLFNDPFDSVINFDYRSEVEQLVESRLVLYMGEGKTKEIMKTSFVSELLASMADQLERSVGRSHKQLEESMYTTCFSEKENLYSLRMWGHYANSHKGVCAEYEFCDVNQSTPFTCIPVKYTDSYEYLIDPQDVAEQVRDFLKLYTKSKEWQYEKEWRVSQIRENYKAEGYAINFVYPRKIYLGCKTDERLKNDILRLCENQEIELYQMKMQPGSFCIDIEKL